MCSTTKLISTTISWLTKPTDNLVEDELEDGGFGPRITEADIANDRTTVNRRLQEYYLLVKKNDPQTDKAKWFSLHFKNSWG